MKKGFSILSLGLIFILAVVATSCVEGSKKYKELQAQLDSLQSSYGTQKNQLDDIFGALNEIESGLDDIRKTENILTIETANEKGCTLTQKEKIESDIAAIRTAIAGYQEKIEKLKNDATLKSVEFKKRLNSLQSQLNDKLAVIQKLTNELESKDLIIKEKDETIAELGNQVSDLQENVEDLNAQADKMQGTIANQERELHSAYYIAATKDELIKLGVITKGGLFSSSKVSYQAEKSAFIKIDYRQVSVINTNSRKAKVLSIHPEGTYRIENVDDEDIITIRDPEKFWEQTKYLVIQVQ